MVTPNLELTDEDKARVNTLIDEIESDTGLEFCLIYGTRPGGIAREEAERAFARLGLHERPGVMVQISAVAKSIEVLTSREAGKRLTDHDCGEAIRLMTGLFATGRIAEGLESGFRFLAKQAGAPPADAPPPEDLPNVVDLDDPPAPA